LNPPHICVLCCLYSYTNWNVNELVKWLWVLSCKGWGWVPSEAGQI
jgi:hypothetical protein